MALWSKTKQRGGIMAWNPFRRKKPQPDAPVDQSVIAPEPVADSIKWPTSVNAVKEIEAEAYKRRRAAEIRATERTAMQGIIAGDEAYNKAIDELTNPHNREAAAIEGLINKFVPTGPITVTHKEGDTYIAHVQAAKGGGFAIGTDNESVFNVLESEIQSNTGDLTDFITQHLATPESVVSINSVNNPVFSTMVGGKFSRTVYADIAFTIDREKFNGYSEKIAAGQLQKTISLLGAKDFEVRPRGKSRDFAIDIRGNDPIIRRKITEKLTELGVVHDSELQFSRHDKLTGEDLPFDPQKGDIRYIRIAMPPNLGAQIDMLKDIESMNTEIGNKKDTIRLRGQLSDSGDTPPQRRI